MRVIIYTKYGNISYENIKCLLFSPTRTEIDLYRQEHDIEGYAHNIFVVSVPVDITFEIKDDEYIGD